MNTPAISAFGAFGYRFTWSIEAVEIILDSLRESTRDGIRAEVTVISSRMGEDRVVLIDDLNLKSSRSRSEVCSQLTKLQPGIEWSEFLQFACLTATLRNREGTPCLLLTESVPTQPVTFRLNPLVYEKQPSVIYAPGGSCKSLLAMLCGLLVAKGGYFNVCLPNGEVRHSRLCAVPGNVLYLDWESELELLAGRRKKLTAGHPELKHANLHYVRMHRSLAEDVRKVHQYVKRYDIDLVIVDSLAPACGGEAISSETAIRYHSALRSLEVSSLAVAHVAKDQNGEAKTIYGSVFFTNLARSVWQIQAQQQEQGSNIRRLVLSHMKVNEGPLQQSMGFSLTFHNASVSVSPLDPADIAEPTLERTATQRIQQAMKEGFSTVMSISNQTGLSDNIVRARLNDGKGRWCSKPGDKEWVLTTSS